MNRSRKFEQRIGNTVEDFMLLFIKKHLSLRVVAKKPYRVVVRLYRSIHYAISLTPSGESFFANNAITK